MTDLLTELQCTQPPFANCFRLIVLGSAKVGKTNIVRRFLHNEFTDVYLPTIEDFHRKIYKIHNDVYQLDVLDTSGMHPFPAMRRLSFLTGDAFILVYSVDSRESFEEVLRLREQILESIRSADAGSNTKRKQHPKSAIRVPIVIAGNKADRPPSQHVVPSTEVEATLARLKERCAFVECSAKANVNIVELFETLFILADLPDEMIPNPDRRISLTHGGRHVVINGPNFALHSRPQQNQGNDASTRRNKWKEAKTAMVSAQGPALFSAANGITLRRRLSDAYSALITNVRRPSIKADLIMVHRKRQQTESKNQGKPRNKYRQKKRTREDRQWSSEREASLQSVLDDEEEELSRFAFWRKRICC